MKYTLILLFIAVVSSCSKIEHADNNSLKWFWLESNSYESAQLGHIHQELFGSNSQIRRLQSMSIYDDKVFCFNDGTFSYVFDINSKKVFDSGTLPKNCHNNNAQFLDIYYNSNDKYPLLLLSRGDSPPNQNEFYIVRVLEEDNKISFNIIKTIKNTILAARNGGCWIADTKGRRLFMYAMTAGDWRITKDNNFCIYSFDLPDLLDPSDIVLGYDDIKSYWQYTYLLHQGGTFYNGYLFFNVQNLPSIDGKVLKSSFNVLAINTQTGNIDAILPLDEDMETEGICVYNDKLFVSFKNGIATQSPNSIVFRLNEYTLPNSILNQIK